MWLQGEKWSLAGGWKAMGAICEGLHVGPHWIVFWRYMRYKELYNQIQYWIKEFKNLTWWRRFVALTWIEWIYHSQMLRNESGRLWVEKATRCRKKEVVEEMMYQKGIAWLLEGWIPKSALVFSNNANGSHNGSEFRIIVIMEDWNFLPFCLFFSLWQQMQTDMTDEHGHAKMSTIGTSPPKRA